MWGSDTLAEFEQAYSEDCIRVGLRVALRVGKIVQGEMMARHKAYAQNLIPSDVPNMILGIEPNVQNSIHFMFSDNRWVSGFPLCKEARDYIAKEIGDMSRHYIVLSRVSVTAGLQVAVSAGENCDGVGDYIRDDPRTCSLTVGMVDMPRWGVLPAFLVCFELDQLEFFCLANAILSGRYPVDLKEHEAPWTLLGSSYPRLLINKDIHKMTKRKVDVTSDIAAMKIARTWR